MVNLQTKYKKIKKINLRLLYSKKLYVVYTIFGKNYPKNKNKKI